MADIHKPFIAGILALIISLLLYDYIKNLIPYTAIVSIIVFFLIYAGIVYLLRI